MKFTVVFLSILLILSNQVYCLDKDNNFELQIEDHLNKDCGWYNGAHVGIGVYDITQDRMIISKNSDEMLNPASVMKLIATYVYLNQLGVDFKFKTPFLLNRNKIINDVYEDDIYISGQGDPSTTVEDLDVVCEKIKSLGIKKIFGNLIYDISKFDEENIRYFPIARNLYAPPCALSINFNSIDLKLIEKPQIKLIPYPDTSYAKIEYNLKIEHTNKPSSPEMIVTMYDNYDFYRINGTVTDWTQNIKYLSVAVTRPGLYYATLFKEKLKKNGIEFTGNIIKNELLEINKNYTPVYVVESKSLSEILKIMNYSSNNLIAENLCKYLGGTISGYPSSREKGVEAIKKVLLESGFKKNHFIVLDACGLAKESRLTTNHVITILKLLYNNSQWREVVMNSLVSKEFKNMKAYVKTGTLSATGVNSLAGYIRNDVTGKIYAFCILVNKPGKVAYTGTYTNSLLFKILEILRTHQ